MNVVQLKTRGPKAKVKSTVADFAALAARIRTERGAQGIDVASLSYYERALIAAMVSTTTRAATGRTAPNAILNGQAAEWLQIPKATVSAAKVVLRGATKAEIAKLAAGEIGFSTLRLQIVAGMTAAQRAAYAASPLNTRGQLPQKVQQQRLTAGVWRRLRDGIENLAGLPAPHDVVAIARAMDRAGLVDRKALQAQSWLEAFVDEWTRPASDS